MILKCNNEELIKLLRYVETLSLKDKIRLSINIFESKYVDINNNKALNLLKRLLATIDADYNNTKYINFLEYKHLLLTSAQVMELTKKEKDIFTFELLFNIYSVLIKKQRLCQVKCVIFFESLKFYKVSD